MPAIYREAKVYFDRWEVKSWASIQLSFGLGNPAMAILQFPYDDSVFELPFLTRISITLIDHNGDEYIIFSGFPVSIESVGANVVIKCEEAFSFLKYFNMLTLDVANPLMTIMTGYFIAGDYLLKFGMPLWEIGVLTDYFKSTEVPDNADDYAVFILKFREALINFMRSNIGGNPDQSNDVGSEEITSEFKRDLDQAEQYMASFIRANLIETLFLPLISDFDFQLMKDFLLYILATRQANLESFKKYNSILELLQSILSYLQLVPASLPIRKIPEIDSSLLTFKEVNSLTKGFPFYMRIHIPQSGFLNCPPAVIRNLDEFSYSFSRVVSNAPTRTLYLTDILGQLSPVIDERHEDGTKKKKVKTNKKPVKQYRMFGMAPIELMIKIRNEIDRIVENYKEKGKIKGKKIYEIDVREFFRSSRIYSEKEIYNGVRPKIDYVPWYLQHAIGSRIERTENTSQELFLSTLVESLIATAGGALVMLQGAIDADIIPGVPVLFLGEDYSFYGIPVSVAYTISPFGPFNMSVQIVTSGVRKGRMKTDDLLEVLYKIYYENSNLGLMEFMERYVSLLPWIPPTLSLNSELKGFLPPRSSVESYKAIVKLLGLNVNDLIKEEKVFNRQSLEREFSSISDDNLKKTRIKTYMKISLQMDALSPMSALMHFSHKDSSYLYFTDISSWPLKDLAAKRRRKIYNIVNELNKLSRKVVKQ